MKIILSRKGFDSGYGGYPSPILPDGRLVSLPIPYTSESIKYSDLMIDENRTYYDLMKDLNMKIRYDHEWHKLCSNTTCHCDPDLNSSILKRSNHWKPAFGQNIQSQSHLRNEGVGKGDLFLFFGWFRQTVLRNGLLMFEKSAPDLHIIFGYLQVEDVIPIGEKSTVPDHIKMHPHATNADLKKSVTNTVYLGKNHLSWDKNRPGAGVFNFADKFVLTKDGEPRSRWNLPLFFKDVRISRHSEKHWSKDGYFQSVAIGQEFVIEDNEKVEAWAKSLF